MLDVDAHFLTQFPRRGGALGCVLQVSESLLGPIHEDDEGGHETLLLLAIAKRSGTGAVAPV
jgi:hypothetical protein